MKSATQAGFSCWLAPLGGRAPTFGAPITANITLLYDPHMATKPVQISLDVELLERVDADPETRERGRSAFVRTAIERYLAARARQRLDAQITAAYTDVRDDMHAEATPFIERQSWPDE
jgi:predicted transcriptional regulator